MIVPAIAGQDETPLQIEFHAFADTGGKVVSLQKGMTMKSGDYYGFAFKANQDCFVYIFQIDSSGAINQLFPMESYGKYSLQNRNPVAKGKQYIIPRNDLWFYLDSKVGEEKIILIGSRTALTDLETQFQSYSNSSKQIIASVPQVQPSADLADSKTKLFELFKHRGVTVVEDKTEKISMTTQGGQAVSPSLSGKLMSSQPGVLVDDSLTFWHK